MQDVFVSISSDREAFKARGKLREKDGFLYVYVATDDGKYRIKYGDGVLRVLRLGGLEYEMLFDKGQEHVSTVTTPFGTTHMKYVTKDLTFSRENDAVSWNVAYRLSGGEDVKLNVYVSAKEDI